MYNHQNSDLIDNTYANTKEVAKRQYDVVMDNGIIEGGNELILGLIPMIKEY